MFAPRSVRLLGVAIGTTVAWYVVLICLAALTANPARLNRDQILRADYVITSTLPVRAVQNLVAEKEWKSGAALGRITIDNLDDVGFYDAAKYLVPLTGKPGAPFRVTPTRLVDNRPLVYQATPESIEQLRQILKQ